MATSTQKSKAARAPEKKTENKVAKKPATAQRSQKPETAKPPAYMQAKLAVSHPQDSSEKEADKVAQQVARAAKPAPAPTEQTTEKKVQRASLEPAITPDKADTMALKPVPAAENIQRRPAPSGATPEKKLDKKDETPATPGKGGTTTVQREAADPMAGQPTSDETENRIEASRGAGNPLPAAVGADMSAQFNQDFSAVRIHNDKEAADLCAETGARAFTVGNDIFFAPGEFAPESDSGRELLAHELTHVVQQDSTEIGRQVYRKPATPPPSGASASSGANASTVDHATKNITIPVLQVPKYSRKANSVPQPLDLPKNPTRPDDQRQVWSDGILASGGYADAIKKNVNTKRGIKNAKTDKMVHVIQPLSSDTYIIGDSDSLPAKVTLPRWDKGGSFSRYDVDHIREMQLGGTNELSNMEMLDASANRSSGSLIHAEIVSKLEEAIQPEVGAGKHWKKAPDLKKVQSEYQVRFASTSPTLNVAGDPENYWSVNDVSTGKHIKATKTLTANEINNKHLIGDSTHLVIYPRVSGGGANKIPWKPDTNTPDSFNGKGIFQNFEATSISYTPGAGGSITGTKKFGKDLLEEKTVSWKLVEMESMDYTVYVDKSSVLASLVPASVPGASPVSFSELDLDDRGALTATGVLRPDLPLLKGLELDLSVSADQIWLSKTFDGGDLNFPGPIQVMSSSLTLSAGTDGLKINGDVNYEITKLGKGKISGIGTFGGSTGTGFGIKGNFELDKELFDGEARIEAGYEQEAFWAKGHLSISKGKIRGIQSASIDASYAKDTFTATGMVTPDIPAVDTATLSIEYSEAAGLKFVGDIGFKGNPLISEGKLHVEAAQPAGADNFKVKGNGNAKPNIPGISSELTATYDDGTFTAEFSGAYARGMLSGTVLVGVTNRSVGDDGSLSGEAAAPDAPLVVYGNGSATVKIAPWLQGTAGIRFAPNGEVTVIGEIGLPSQLEIFSLKEINKPLFAMSTQIPIFPGIVAEVGGNLCAHASIGPGALDQMRIGIEYNPAHEENTHITGDAHLNIPAEAGVRLGARAGIGLGITGASATGGLELGGTLGISGAAEAGVHIDWMPSTGLSIDAEGYLHAEPKFKFDVSGYVAVTALGFSVYDNTWQLAAYELGSNLRLGVRFHIHYREGQPFNVSLDDVKFEVPDVDPAAMISDLGSRIF